MLVDRGPRKFLHLHIRAFSALLYLRSTCNVADLRTSHAVEDDMAPCKFAEKVWNAQEAGAQGVRQLPLVLPFTGAPH